MKKKTKIFFNNKLIENDVVYTTHDKDNNEYQHIPNLIDNLGSGDKAVLMYDYQCLEDFEIPYHWHDWYEMIYIFSGKVDVQVDKKRFELRQGGYFYFSSGVMHKTTNYQNARVLVMHIKKDYINTHFPKWESFTIDVDHFYQDMLTNEKDQMFISDLIEQLYTSYNDDNAFNEIGYHGLLDYILYQLNKLYGDQKKSTHHMSEKYKNRLMQIFNYIDDNIYERIELNDLANHLDVSPQYLSKIFRTYLNMTFTEYVNEQRLHKAINDVIYTDLTLLEIALKYGFSNYQSFLKAFRVKYKISPSKYRELKNKGRGKNE